MKYIEVASKNQELFWRFLESMFPPLSKYEKINYEQVDDFWFDVYYVFQYGQMIHRTHVCKMWTYPRFDEAFDPSAFYANKDAVKYSQTNDPGK